MEERGGEGGMVVVVVMIKVNSMIPTKCQNMLRVQIKCQPKIGILSAHLRNHYARFVRKAFAQEKLLSVNFGAFDALRPKRVGLDMCKRD